MILLLLMLSTSLNFPQNFRLNKTIPIHLTRVQKLVGGQQILKIYDVLGREIETLVDEYKEAGNHSTLYIVNSTLPSGVYFYQLRSDKYIETKKMILLR